MIELIAIVGSIVLGFFVGRRIEKNHFQSIRLREAEFRASPAVTIETSEDREIEKSALVSGSVVISIDAFKKLLAGIVNIFGGEVHAYSSLVDRARREAILRMKESAPDASAYLNMRVETATIHGKNQGNVSSVEVFAYATAVTYKAL